MDICRATQEDNAHLARLLWLNASAEQQARQSVETFAVDLGRWWIEHRDSHLAFIARLGEREVVGMAWLALVDRAPRPGEMSRRSADIQSVFVEPEQRGQGFGSAVVQAAAEYAMNLGVNRVTVQSGRRAVPLYERLGFASSRQLLQKTAD